MSTRIYRACDACEVEGVDSPGVQRGPLWDRTVDVCEAHWDTMTVKDLVALVEDRGAPVAAVARKGPGRPRKAPVAAAPAAVVRSPGGGFLCPLCGQEAPTAGALGKHLERHDSSIVDVYGTTCPMCGFEGTARVGQHTSRSHGIPGGIVGAFAAAEAAGDPHGVVAARRKAWAGMA